MKPTVAKIRRAFLSMIVRLVVVLAAARLGAVRAEEPTTVPRGGRVAWARLITHSAYWDIHADCDPALANFIRKETTLNIDPTWFSVSPARLDQLCRIPLIYVKDLSYVRGEGDLQNIREYLQRGGFLCIDTCAQPPRTTDMEVYFRTNRDIARRVIAGAEVRPLPETHAIYHCYFGVQRGDIYTPKSRPLTGEHDGLYGVFDGERMVGVISMYGLECGWLAVPDRKAGCMKMIVNIYVYAMTRGSEPRASPR
jgi:hypothetical protein